MPDVVVIGAGVSGLTCAWQLQRRGLDALILETSDRPGGVIDTHEIDGCLVESGPNTILPTSETLEVIQQPGLDEQLIVAPSGAPRFIYIGGRLKKVPWVLSPSGFLRALAEPFISRRPDGVEESVRSFFTRRFGRQVHDRLAGPFVGGIYAGDTAGLSVEAAFPRLTELEKRHRSVMLGMLKARRGESPRPKLSSFRKGMRTLPEFLSRGLNIRYQVSQLKIADRRVESTDGSFPASAVVTAVPAYVAAELLGEVHAPLADLLASVDYAPLIVAATLVDESHLPARLEGFGFLVPRGQGIRMLGSLFSSALFPGRSPAGTQLLTSFLGGALDTEVAEWSDDRVWDTVDRELRVILKLKHGPKPVRLFRYGRAIPQYSVGHTQWLESVQASLRSRESLFLTGNYLTGVSVPAAMEHGKRTADAVFDWLRRNK